jgi:shikimate dehydrogenase
MTSSGHKRAGVAGWPIAHSLSPALHGFWIAEHRLDASYVPLAIKPDEFDQAVLALPAQGFRGLNVTLPHKEAAFRLAATHDDAARATGAVNTLVFENGRVSGRNTDVFGFAESVREKGVSDLHGGIAVVLGAGGASRAVIAALLTMRAARVVVVNRTVDKAEALAGFFGERVVTAAWGELPDQLSRATILVNTTSLGMTGQPALGIDVGPMPQDGVVVDIVYRPLETPLLARARARGLRVVDGLGMLLHQARPGFAAWFGVEPKVTPQLRAQLVSILEGRT